MDKPVKGMRKIGIYGSRLVMSAIGASLHEQPGFKVQRIEGLLPEDIEKLMADLPDVILFDLAAGEPHFAIQLIHIHPTVLVIGVDLADNKMLVFSGKQSRFLTTEDLVRVIEAAALK